MKKREIDLLNRLRQCCDDLGVYNKYLNQIYVDHIFKNIETMLISFATDSPNNDYADEDYEYSVKAIEEIEYYTQIAKGNIKDESDEDE